MSVNTQCYDGIIRINYVSLPAKITSLDQEIEYYKIDKLVHCNIQVALSAKDDAMSGYLGISGLPFTSKYNDNRYCCAVVGSVFGLTHGAYNGVSGTLSGSSAMLELRKLADTSAHVKHTDISSEFRIIISLEYETI